MANGNQRVIPKPFIENIQNAGSHLAVRLRSQKTLKAIIRRQLMIIFYDPVMDQGYASLTVGMGVFIGNPAMGSPACMADSAVRGFSVS